MFPLEIIKKIETLANIHLRILTFAKVSQSSIYTSPNSTVAIICTTATIITTL